MRLCGLPIVVQRDGPRHLITIAMRTDGTSNHARREHWAARSKRVAAERTIVTTAMRMFRSTDPANDNGDPDARYLVRLVRLAPRLCDDDGAIHALKTVRDMVAAGLGTDDSPTGRCQWCYAQEKCRVRGVRIELERVS